MAFHGYLSITDLLAIDRLQTEGWRKRNYAEPTCNLEIREPLTWIQALKVTQREDEQVYLREVIGVAGPGVDFLTEGNLAAGTEATCDAGDGVGTWTRHVGWRIFDGGTTERLNEYVWGWRRRRDEQ